MILNIPVRRKTVRIDGADRSVLELANGFVAVTPDDNANAVFGQSAIGNDRGRFLISNPLAEAFIDWFNRGMIGANEKIAIVLEELPYSNPGTDDEGPSLTHLDVIV